MTLIKSISGIRGTIGGAPGENLTPLDAMKFASAYAEVLKKKSGKRHPTVVLGRDARMSGEMIKRAVISGLTGMGVHVKDLDLSTTPSVEMAVKGLQADGGIILTASHNPVEWNALKMLDANGEFISAETGKEILALAENEDFIFEDVWHLGGVEDYPGGYIREHIESILNLPVIDAETIREKGFRVVVDAVDSTGGIAVPMLLDALGVSYECMYCEPTGRFPHNPEPLEKNLGDIMRRVAETGADLGIVVDPDVDRLALIDENGQMFGEEYTLVAAADYILSKIPGPTVSNLSSTRALRDITQKYGQKYFASAVGEVNVVKKMKETGAVIGGEGNGGVIYPDLHYGRDALLGIALILSLLAERNVSLSALKKTYPQYFMAKEKIRLHPGLNIDGILDSFALRHLDAKTNREDGVKLDYPDYWIHLRRSNTEPIIRIYVEAKTPDEAREIAEKTLEEIKKFM